MWQLYAKTKTDQYKGPNIKLIDNNQLCEMGNQIIGESQ